MKKIFFLIFSCFLYQNAVFSQFSASLSGYPLVTTGWNIGGFASVIDSEVQLTAALGGQNGYVYYNTPVNLIACSQFTVKFDYQITAGGGFGVADGIAFFYISNPPSGFISGGGLGLPNPINGGMVFTLDTWDNDGDGLNPESQLFGYSVTSTYDESNRTQMLTGIRGHETTMDDGTWHHCEIDYNAGNINVYYDYSIVPGMTAFYVLTVPSGYFGFSASTGAGFSQQSVKSIHITAEGILPPPTVTSPIVYCQHSVADTLTASGIGPFHWYTTDTATVVSLPGSPTPGTGALGATTYFVRQGAGACISSPASVEVIINPPLPAPVIHGITPYCQGEAFVPFTLTGLTDTALWYPTGTGGVGSHTATVLSTAIPGFYTVWVSQVTGGCESARDSFTVHVVTTPPAPMVTGTLQYCQFIGPFVPLTVNTTRTGATLWYNAASGGTGVSTEPAVNIAVPGTYNFWVSQVDSGCEGPRTPVIINVYPKPNPPVVTRQGPYCQFALTDPLVATASGTGDNLTWFGIGIAAAGTALPPVPQADTAEVDTFYVNETSVYGCVSNKALDTIRVIPKPSAPRVTDTTYCQGSPSVPLNFGVDSARGSHLNWYQAAVAVRTPVPSTTLPGTAVWYVSQTVNTCQGDSVAIHVTTIYLPKFTITSSSPWVCDLDSIALTYTGSGTPLQNGAFLWTLPPGDSFTTHSHATDSSVLVKFDSASLRSYIYLKASDNNGRCFATDTLPIKVVSQPSAVSFTKTDVCLGDTVSLAVNTKTANAATFKWLVDYSAPLISSAALNVIAANSSSGGPFSISWVDTGQHVIQLNSFTEEGCTSVATYDTVSVHTPPDASFKILAMTSGKLCIEDSVQFGANTDNYNYSYLWSPAHSFTNIDKPIAWGKVEQSQSMITLTVTDPFGCAASTVMQLDPGSCCTVNFPNAFTPNGDGHNDYFRPLFPGYQTVTSSLNNMSYHTFHVFRIANRWGQTVFESSNSDLKWDGTFNGVPQDMGVYYYYIKYDCGGQTMEQSGDVTLIR